MCRFQIIKYFIKIRFSTMNIKWLNHLRISSWTPVSYVQVRIMTQPGYCIVPSQSQKDTVRLPQKTWLSVYSSMLLHALKHSGYRLHAQLIWKVYAVKNKTKLYSELIQFTIHHCWNKIKKNKHIKLDVLLRLPTNMQCMHTKSRKRENSKEIESFEEDVCASQIEEKKD